MFVTIVEVHERDGDTGRESTKYRISLVSEAYKWKCLYNNCSIVFRKFNKLIYYDLLSNGTVLFFIALVKFFFHGLYK